ncbi:MAG TPA: Hpt domain-containing protein [Burkholderiales bacterium]|nr:Hpt domain-containing protein [Burkholderiales bacterium]
MSAAFDIGPLSWVKSEIDSSLERARAALQAYGGRADARGELRNCRIHLHQAAGAVQIVGLEGVSRFFEETEALAADLEVGRIADEQRAVRVLEGALTAIGAYLSDLMEGALDQPLRLFPTLEALCEARGAPRPAEADLFYPDLSLAPPPREKPAVRLPREEAGAYLRSQSTRFQRALVKWLRQPADRDALEDMLAAVDAVEQTQSIPAQRAFWWASGAFIDALAKGDLAPDPGVRQVATHVEQQLRRLVEGSPSVAERVLREVLYWVARAGGVGGAGAREAASLRVLTTRQAYRLEGSLPQEEVEPDVSQRMSMALALRESLASAKDAWTKYAAGIDSALAAFVQHARAIAERGSRLGNADLAALTLEISRVAGHLDGAMRSAVTEAVAMEVATALLLAEGAAENYRNLPSDFDREVKVMLARLAVAVFGAEATGPLPTAGLIDEMTRRAQERLATVSALAEMKANLHRIEQTLDAYFRDPTRAGELGALEPLVHQVSGALGVLGEEQARAALERCAARIREFAEAEVRPQLAEFEEVAQILSGLGFYIDALQHGKADFAAAMRPVGIAEAAAEADETAARSLESVLRSKARSTHALYQALRETPQDEHLRSELKDKLVEIRDDAELVADSDLRNQASEALSQLDSVSADRSERLAFSITELAPSPPPPSAEAVRLKDASDEAIDQELLAIFLEEADGVLAAISDSLRESRAQPASLPQLVTIRRGFHTLKGSGRMVGLARLGEIALAVEQVLNLWLQDERSATPDLHALIDLAHRAFVDWIARLRAGEPQPDPSGVLAVAERVKRGEAAEPAAPAAAARAQEEEVVIDGKTISASLFAVFGNEARQHLDTLERELASTAATHAIGEELVRAAHTLASISGTVQLEPMHALGYALEAALARLRARATPPDAAELTLLAGGNASLREMYGEAIARRAPAARADLVQALEAIPGRTEEAQVVAPVRSEQPAQERRQRRIDDDIDAQLLPLFLQEGAELLPQAGELLRAWRSDPADLERAKALQRVLHTFKGSARMAGVMSLGELTHHMETRVENAIALKLSPAQLFDDLDLSFDRVSALLERLQKPLEEAAPARPRAEQAAPALSPELGPARGLLRVRADMLEKLVNQAGEVAITRSRIEVEMRALKTALADLTENVARLRGQLREIEIQAESQMQARVRQAEEAALEFDPLEFDRFTRFQELTRMMAESVNDVATVQQNLTRVVDDTDAALSAQARLNRDLQQDLMRVRMVPFGTLAQRLHRLVRQTAKELGKRASLELRGVGVELDRSVLERITGPLEHLLRNALTHGIEAPAERAARGKTEGGEIRLDVRQEGNEVVLALADDGAGLNLEKIRATAVGKGLLAAADAPSEQQLADLIFMPGFSTVEEVTEIAGRGIGMDVVKDEVGALGGRVELESSPGRGTRFVIRLPLTTAVTQTVLVKSGARTYALPGVMVEQVQQLRPEQLTKLRAIGRVEWAGRRYPFAYLPELLGEAGAPAHAERRYAPVLLLRSGAEAAALLVDEMIGNQEVVVKNLGPQLARVPGISSITVLGSGETVLILNPVPLVRRPRPAPQPEVGPAPAVQAARPRVMVVDDSLTVRKITGRLLEREGYQVTTAKDGVEALEKLSLGIPDVMLIDIEMPRMDGFDLTRNLRADPKLAKIPVIMITSRTADKHRAYAQELGVNVFLGKPYQEQELLGHIAGFVGR